MTEKERNTDMRAHPDDLSETDLEAHIRMRDNLQRLMSEYDPAIKVHEIYPGLYSVEKDGRVMATLTDTPVEWHVDEWRDNPPDFREFIERRI